MENRALLSQRQTVAKGHLLTFCLTAGLFLFGFFAIPEHSQASGQLEAKSITAGGQHSCAIRPSGQAVCWGFNLTGQLGDGTDTRRSVPTTVRNLADAKVISAGYRHSCAIRNSGQAVCWGRNSSGELGDGTTKDRLTPTPVQGLTDAIAISAGETHTCAIRASGQAMCWGINWYGKVGDGTTEEDVIKDPTPVQGLADAKFISAGFNHSCAIRTSGQAVCWGANYDYQVGDGTDESRFAPVSVAGLTDATTITTGSNSACATRASGQALCWGSNAYGELGNGNDLTAMVPTAVGGLTDAESVVAGYAFACGMRNSGQTLCWGWNPSGELGNGTIELDPTTSPVPVQGLGDAKSIDAGMGHACAIRTSGLAICWGSNQEGKLGDGTRDDRLVPTPVLDGIVKPSVRIAGLSVTPIRSKVKPGKKVKLKIKIKNTGDAAGKLVVKLSSTNRQVKVPARVKVTVPAGRSITRKVTVKATRKARGQAKLTIKVAGRKVSATIKVQRRR